MSVYAAVAAGLRTSQSFQQNASRKALDTVEKATNGSTTSPELLQMQVTMGQAQIDLQFAVDLVNIMISNIQQLQP
ncbi:MAG: hypothetical protein VKP62_09685 [Candidatus Sericytochromatia bacterium]|nr:hypothetical protein [Candidatus Sericytochromatia bacterium]